MSNSMELELLTAVYSLLSGDTTLTTASGIDPATGSARAVAVYNNPPQNTPVPYVRITITDTLPLEPEPYDFTTVPSVKTVSLMLSVFTDYEPEVYKVSARVYDLFNNKAITTTHFTGSTWVTALVYTTDNTSSPDHIYQHGATRVRVTLQPS